MGHSKSSPKREINSIIGLLQETRKITNKQPNVTLKGTRKKTTKPQVSRMRKLQTSEQKQSRV